MRTTTRHLIAGASKPKKESLTEVVAGAATRVLQPASTPTKQNVIVDDGTKISPLKVASLRRSCLEDLKELFEDNVLSETEFTNEKEQVLSALKNISKWIMNIGS